MNRHSTRLLTKTELRSYCLEDDYRDPRTSDELAYTTYHEGKTQEPEASFLIVGMITRRRYKEKTTSFSHGLWYERKQDVDSVFFIVASIITPWVELLEEGRELKGRSSETMEYNLTTTPATTVVHWERTTSSKKDRRYSRTQLQPLSKKQIGWERHRDTTTTTRTLDGRWTVIATRNDYLQRAPIAYMWTRRRLSIDRQ